MQKNTPPFESGYYKNSAWTAEVDWPAVISKHTRRASPIGIIARMFLLPCAAIFAFALLAALCPFSSNIIN